MKILAIEASGPVAGCAVLEDGLLIADYNVQYKKKHAQSLVPMMDEVKRMLELEVEFVNTEDMLTALGRYGEKILEVFREAENIKLQMK